MKQRPFEIRRKPNDELISTVQGSYVDVDLIEGTYLKSIEAKVESPEERLDRFMRGTTRIDTTKRGEPSDPKGFSYDIAVKIEVRVRGAGSSRKRMPSGHPIPSLM